MGVEVGRKGSQKEVEGRQLIGATLRNGGLEKKWSRLCVLLNEFQYLESGSIVLVMNGCQEWCVVFSVALAQLQNVCIHMCMCDL